MTSGNARQYLKTLPAGTYTLSANPINTSVNLCNSTGVVLKIVNSSQPSISFTLNEETEIFIRLTVSSGVTVNETVKIQLEQGSVVTEWEPFTNGASPNPDYEQPIHRTGDNVNLFDKNAQVTSTGNITSYTNNNGIYTIIPTGTGNPQIRIECIIPAGTYILNSEVYLSATQVLRSANATLKNFGSQYKSQNFITTADSTEILFNWDNPGNTNPITLDLTTLKIEKGKATPYSPYGMGCISEKFSNRNVFPTNECKTFQATLSAWMSLDGVKGAYVANFQEKCKAWVYLPAGTYTCKPNNTENISILQYMKEDTTLIETISDFSRKITFTLTEAHYIIPRVRVTEANVDSYLDIQIEPGTEATPYVDHKEKTYIIPTQQPMRSNDDVRDLFVKENSNDIERHLINRKIFDGTENWTVIWSDTQAQRYGYACNITNAIYPANADILSQIKSNFYKTYKQSKLFRPSGESEFVDNGICVRANNSQVIIKDNDYTSVEAFKQMLATKYSEGNPLYVDYLLSEPLDLPCTEEQIEVLEEISKAETYKGGTVVMSEDEVPAYVDMIYIKDLETVINNLSN